MSLSPPSLDWMVLQCSACGTRMKAPRGLAAASRLLCPQCHAPVPFEDEDTGPGEPEAFRPSALPPREHGMPASHLPQPQRESITLQGGSYADGPRAVSPVAGGAGGSHPEFHGRLEDDAEEERDDGEGYHDPAAGERRRVKIKKRRTKRTEIQRYKELTDWDQSELTHIPEAEVAADIWADARSIPEDVAPAQNENEYVVESVEGEDGQTRTTKKKVRRRRLLLGARLLFQRFTWLSRYLTAALAVAVAAVAVYGFYVFRQQYEAPPLPPVTEPPIDRSVLTQYDELGAEKAVRDFLAADGIEAKLAFVRQPDRIRPLMKRWYRGERAAGPLQAGEPTMRDKKGGEPGSEGYYVMLAMPVLVPDLLNPGSVYEEMTFFAIEEIRNGPESTYLVDWETSTGYQELPLETFKQTMPPEAYPFRIYMKADNYYNHGFSETDWQCVALYYPGRDFHLYGYISRNSREGRDMLPLVGEGQRAGVIAELVYPSNPASRDQVIVKRLLHSSWFYAKPEDAQPDQLQPSILSN